MKIATWNVNSVRMRVERLVAWLAAERPDVVCLQEIKCTTDAFPWLEIEAAGYHAAVHGQKTWNGVALLARGELRDVETGFDDPTPVQSRMIAATVDGVRVASVYVPNGSAIGSDKYDYKRAWLPRLEAWMNRAGVPSGPVVVCGDFNICPDERDVHDVATWEGTVLFNPEMRAAWARLIGLGVEDVFRRHHPEGGQFSFWDYQGLSFPKNLGLRLDFVLATPALAARCTAARIDRDQRKGVKPSDHAPVIAEFDVPPVRAP